VYPQYVHFWPTQKRDHALAYASVVPMGYASYNRVFAGSFFNKVGHWVKHAAKSVGHTTKIVGRKVIKSMAGNKKKRHTTIIAGVTSLAGAMVALAAMRASSKLYKNLFSLTDDERNTYLHIKNMEDSKEYNEELFSDARGQLADLREIQNDLIRSGDPNEDILSQLNSAIEEAEKNVDNLAHTISDIDSRIPNEEFATDEDYFDANFSLSGDDSFASLYEEYNEAGLDAAADIIESGATAGEAAGEDG